MGPSRFVRFAGLTGLVGGVAYVVALLVTVAYNVSGLWQIYPTPVTWLALPSVWLFYLLSLLGWHAFLAQQVGWGVWLFGVVAAIGALMLLIGGIGISYVWYSNSLSIEHMLTTDPVGEAFRYYLYAASFLGYPVLGLGLLGSGWLAVRVQALGRLSWLPPLLGVLSIMMYFVTDMGAPSLLRDTGTPGLVVMVLGQLTFGLTWACGWILIGRRLWGQQAGGAAVVGVGV
jgi:hypothetical protein